MTFMAYRSPGRSLLSANLTCEKAPLNTVDNYSYGYMSKYIFDKVTHVPRTSLRMYLSSTVGAFLAVDSTAGDGGGPVPAGLEPDDAGFFLPKSGMSAAGNSRLALFFSKTMGAHSLHSLSMQISRNHTFHTSSMYVLVVVVSRHCVASRYVLVLLELLSDVCW